MTHKPTTAYVLVLAVAVLGWVAAPVSAQTDAQLLREMQEQIKALQQRVTELETNNSQLQNRLQQQEQSVETQAQKVEKIEKSADLSGKPAVRSSMGVDLYGYLKFDAAYDTARTNTGNFARWVESDATAKNDDQFTATANQTRFGLNFTGPDMGTAKTSGKVEVDFYGGGDENKATFMMRHAYAKIDWPDWDFSLLAGQTWDVNAPLMPSTVNYSVGWWSGDIGYRRPQFRLTKGFDLTEDTRLMFEGAVARTIGDGVFGLNRTITGEDSGFPTLQGRMSLAFPMLTEKPTVLGLSGHYGQEEVDMNRLDLSRDFDTWSAVLDWTVPLTEKVQLTGEAWMGENLDAYLGGIAQGIHGFDLDGNPANGAEFPLDGIRSKGGWGALALGPWGNFTYNLGAALDDPDADDLNAGQRDQNLTVFGNVFWKLNEAILTGFEVSYLDTDYKGQSDGDTMRFQAALIYRF